MSTQSVIGTGIRYFHIETFQLPDQNNLKSLLFLEAEDASLGATVLLRGADLATLTKVKRVLRTAIYTAYVIVIVIVSFLFMSYNPSSSHNLRLEQSALFDLHLGVCPPPFPQRVLSASPHVQFNLTDARPHFPRMFPNRAVDCISCR